MPLSGVNVNNPQTQEAYTQLSTPNFVNFGGNALGTGASTNSAASADEGDTPSFSTILTYGAIALIVIFVLQIFERKGS